MNPEDPVRDLRELRDSRIKKLESRVRARPPLGIRPSVALFGMAAALLLGWMMRGDIAYFFSSAEPITLGSEGTYRLEALVSNRFAQVHGMPTLRGAYAEDRKGVSVIVGLKESPLVRRALLPGEVWNKAAAPPQPNQSPFGIRGRLLSRKEAARFEEAFKLHEEWGEVRPRDGKLWILLEGERPRADAGTLALLGLLGALFFANAYLLIRRFLPEALSR